MGTLIRLGFMTYSGFNTKESRLLALDYLNCSKFLLYPGTLKNIQNSNSGHEFMFTLYVGYIWRCTWAPSCARMKWDIVDQLYLRNENMSVVFSRSIEQYLKLAIALALP